MPEPVARADDLALEGAREARPTPDGRERRHPAREQRTTRESRPITVGGPPGAPHVYSDGKILWKLGGTHRAESLRVKRDRYASAPLDGQHDARMQPDGTLSVHDNGTFGHKRLPRIARYRINARKRIATLVQVINEKRAGHSYCCGNAQRLSGGRWLVDWGANSIIEELTGHGRRVLTITLPNKLFSYRAQSVPPGVLTRDALRAGMDAQFPR